jgi:hypothetical protein
MMPEHGFDAGPDYEDWIPWDSDRDLPFEGEDLEDDDE